MCSVALICVGDELLNGEIANTHTVTIAKAIRRYSCRLVETRIVSDSVESISAAIREMMVIASTVIVTGGLGPTSDDVTRQSIADAVGGDLHFDQEVWEQIRKRMSTEHRSPSRQLRQWRLAVGVVALLILIGSSLPGSSIPSFRLFSEDKLLHLLEYFFFGIVLFNWAGLEFRTEKRHWFILVGVALFAMLDELHQPWFGRSCEFYDWVADMVGVSLALVAGSLCSRWRLRSCS